MDLSLETPVMIEQGVAVADLGDEAVLLDPQSGNYFGLNDVATRILELAGERTTVARIVDQMMGEFEVERPQLESDVIAFVRELKQNGLLRVG